MIPYFDVNNKEVNSLFVVFADQLKSYAFLHPVLNISLLNHVFIMHGVIITKICII